MRQPYSLDAVSQTIARVIFENRAEFEPGIQAIIAERDRLMTELAKIPGVSPYPSHSNWVLFRIPQAADVWQQLFESGILVRDLSGTVGLEGALRVTVGTPEQNDAFLDGVRKARGVS